MNIPRKQNDTSSLDLSLEFKVDYTRKKFINPKLRIYICFAYITNIIRCEDSNKKFLISETI